MNEQPILAQKKPVARLMPLAEIEVGQRARQHLGDIEELAESLRTKGQIQPIVVTRSGKLIAGGRRLSAATLLGWTHIEVVIKEELPPDQLREIELEENLQRKNMTWQELVQGRGELFEMRLERLGPPKGRGETRIGYSLRDFANDLGLASSGSLYTDLQLYQTMRLTPELARFNSKEMALKAMNRAKEQMILTELALRAAREPKVDFDHSGGAVEEDSEASIGEVAIPDWRILVDDCLEVLRGLPEKCVDLVVTDPPWGLGSGLRRLVWPKSEFNDGAPQVVKLRLQVLPEIVRVMKDDAHLYLFMGIDARVRIMEALFELGLDVQTMPLLWIKDAGSSADLSDPCFIPNYETIIFAWKGSRVLNTYSKMTFEHSGLHHEQRIHTAEKPVSLLQEFIKLSSVENELVLDPYAGSGSLVEAAIRLGRRAIGIEEVPEVAQKAKMRIEAVVNELKSAPRIVVVEDEPDEEEW